MRELHFFADDLTKRYGHALYRIGLDSGFSCPHRSSDGRGGCVFCSIDGSRSAHLQPGMSIEEQVAAGLHYVTHRYHAEPPYIAYFQAFTVTNAPVEALRELFDRTMSLADFKVMILATRPDCLPEDVVDLLAEWNQKTELWVELGVQSANDITLKKINRGHDAACAADAVKRLAARGIRTAAHLILGLPGETMEDEARTADWVAALPFSAVKVHNLLVLKNTKLADMYHAGEVIPLNEYEYAARLKALLTRLPEHLLLMRLSAEAQPREIIAPKWWMKKGQFLEFFRQSFDSDAPDSRFLPIRTEDGSYTLYHPAYRQHFHSLAGALEESTRKYLVPAELERLLRTRETVRLLDVGFGLGFNAASAVRLAESCRAGKLEITSLEFDPEVLPAAQMLPEHPMPSFIRALQERGEYESEFCHARILFGDARKTLPGLAAGFDRAFLDGFSPDANPELWTIDFIRTIKEKLTSDGMILAYSSAYPVIGAFLELGFDLRLSEPFGRKRHGLAACLADPPGTLELLSEKDRNIATLSTAGIPWRDPALDRTRDAIRQAKTEETHQRRAEGMPKWYKPG